MIEFSEVEPGDALLTVDEAEKQIGGELSARYIEQLARSGKVKARILPKKASIFVYKKSLEQYVAGKRKPGPRRKQGRGQ